MVDALVFGALASSALVIGAALGSFWTPPDRVLASALAFASGALVTAVAVELFADAYEQAGPGPATVAFLAGAAVFVLVDRALERRVKPGEDNASGGALLAAVTLDGVPENLALGVALITTSPWTLLAAVFASNLPEAMSGAAMMRAQHHSRRSTMAVWSATALLLLVAVVAGRVLLAGASGTVIGVLLAFAAGAVLASLADTLMPSSYAEGGPSVALATAAGFVLSFFLSEL
ncbi:ZIP family zinc transporter [soil metagenome]